MAERRLRRLSTRQCQFKLVLQNQDDNEVMQAINHGIVGRE